MCFNGKEEKKIQIKMSSIRITRFPLDIFAEQVRFVISVSHTLIDGHLALTRWPELARSQNAQSWHDTAPMTIVPVPSTA
jgi:hypothetical protein